MHEQYVQSYRLPLASTPRTAVCTISGDVRTAHLSQTTQRRKSKLGALKGQLMGMFFKRQSRQKAKKHLLPNLSHFGQLERPKWVVSTVVSKELNPSSHNTVLVASAIESPRQRLCNVTRLVSIRNERIISDHQAKHINWP